MPRISVQVLDHLCPGHGQAQSVVQQSQLLAAEGWEIVFLATDCDPQMLQAVSEWAVVRSCDLRPKRNPRIVPDYRRWLLAQLEHYPDSVVVAHDAPDLVALAGYIAQPLLFVAHCHPEHALVSEFPAEQITQALAGCQAVLGFGEHTTQALLDLGSPAERTQAHGPLFLPQAAAPTSLDQIATKSGSPALITVGRLVPVKNQQLLLRSLAELEEYPGARLAILGRGPLEPSLKELAAELGLEERVGFPGLLLGDELQGWLAASDLFVMPSHVEGVSRAVLEAVRAGLPVCVAECMSEVVDHGRLGEVFSSRSQESLTAALRRSLARRIDQPTNELQAHVEERFGRRRIIGNLKAVHEQLLAGRS